MRKKENIQIMRGLAVLLVVFQHTIAAVFGAGGVLCLSYRSASV